MEELNLKIEYVPIETLKPYENNAKIHTEEQIEQIKKSIEEFGMNDPIAVWKDNVVIEGHGRLLALQELGEESVPVIHLDHLSDEQRKAYIIAHNKLTLNTVFDNSILGEELKGLIETFDMTDFGFGDFELTMLTEDFEPEQFDDEEIAEFTQNGEVGLAKKRVIITYTDDEQEYIKQILNVEEVSKVVYDIKEIIK